MLRLATAILENHADIRDVVKSCQRHILVDEFQDVSLDQFEVLKHLIRDPVNDSSLTAVGDDDQIIYTWAGATTEIFDTLRRHCGRDTNQVQLVDNYRCSACILDIGRTILKDNELRVPKALQPCARWADNGQLCPPPLLIQCDTYRHEASTIADEIQHILETSCGNIKPSDIAILYRWFTQGKNKTYWCLKKELESRRIPYTIMREHPFWESAVGQDMIAYLQVMLDAQDDNAFLRIMNRPPRGLGPRLQEQLVQQQDALQREDPSRPRPCLHEIVAKVVSKDGCQSLSQALTIRTKRNLQNLLQELHSLSRTCALQPVHECLKAIVAETNYGTWLQGVKTATDTPKDKACESSSESSSEEADVVTESAAYKKITEAIELAASFAQRWVDPNATRDRSRTSSMMKGGTIRNPDSLVQICARHVMHHAQNDNSEMLDTLMNSIPEQMRVKTAAACGGGPLQVEDFLSWVQTDPKAGACSADQDQPNNEMKRGQGKVSVSTIHAAKGLEWKVVIVPRWNNGFIPSQAFPAEEAQPDGTIRKRQLTEDELREHLEEERRLAHVAVTRAKEQLMITYVTCDNQTVSTISLPKASPECESSTSSMRLRKAPLSD